MRAVALQFRYLFVTDADGLKVVDVTDPASPSLVDGHIAIRDAHKVFVSRTFAYVAAGAEGIVIVDAERPQALREYQRFNAGGALADTRDIVVASTNASLFAYVADGAYGLKVLQLTSPDSQPKFYGFSPDRYRNSLRATRHPDRPCPCRRDWSVIEPWMKQVVRWRYSVVVVRGR